MKILSIVIPMYNTEAYLRRCLDSILVEEVLNDIEVLIINDGSKDNSLALAREYEARCPDTIVVVDKENGGHGSTINKGLEIATGKYFRVLDSDDWFDTCAFKKYITLLKDCDEDLVVTPYYQEYVYNGVQILTEYDKFEYNKTYYFDEMNLEDLGDLYFVMASSTYKTEVLRESQLKLFEKTFYVDMQFNIMPVARTNSIRFLDCNIYRYFIGRPNQSMAQASMIRNKPHHEKVLYFLLDYLNENRDKLSELKIQYIEKILSLMSYTHFNLLGFVWPKRLEAYKLTMDFLNHLKKTNPAVYKRLSGFSEVKCSRLVGYTNILGYNGLYQKVLVVMRKVKQKLCR